MRVEIDSLYCRIDILKEDENESYCLRDISTSFEKVLEKLLTPSQYLYHIADQDFYGKISKRRYNMFLDELKEQCRIHRVPIEDFKR